MSLDYAFAWNMTLLPTLDFANAEYALLGRSSSSSSSNSGSGIMSGTGDMGGSSLSVGSGSSNSVGNSYASQSNVPVYLKILASVFYVSTMLLGVGGNVLVLLIVLYYDTLRTVTNFFIVNLAIADLIFGLLCIPSTYITAYLIQYWPFTAFFCVFLNYMQTVSVTLTVSTLIWITLDKYWALLRPLKLRMSIRKCKHLILVSWLFSLIVSLPIAVVTKLTPMSLTDDLNDTTASMPQCSEIWPTELTKLSHIYNVLLLFIQYLIPLVILTYCYARIGLFFRKRESPADIFESISNRATRSNKKVTKMCFLMVWTFMLFWAPLQFLTVVRFYDENLMYSIYFGDIFFVCHILAMSRSFINPFIYALTNHKFRNGFKYFLACHWVGKHKSSSLSDEQHTELALFRSRRSRSSVPPEKGAFV